MDFVNYFILRRLKGSSDVSLVNSFYFENVAYARAFFLNQTFEKYYYFVVSRKELNLYGLLPF